MIDEIDILHESHSSDFTSHAGEKAAGLLCIIAYHHKIIVELGEYCFDTFAESFISPRRRTPVFLIQPVWHFKADVCDLKKILPDSGAKIAFVAKHHTIVIFPLHILKIMEVVDACRRHIIRMYDTAYSADSVELVTIIVQPLRSTVAPVGRSLDIVPAHGTAFCSCVLTYFDRLGVNAEHIFGTIYCHSHILPDFLSKTCRQLTSDIELPTAYQVWQIVLALMMQTIKKKIFTVESKCLGSYAESYDFEVGELGNNSATGYISKFIHTISGEILADSENSDEICYEVAHKQRNSS